MNIKLDVYKAVLRQYRALLDVVRLSFRKLCQNSPTRRLLFMLVVVREAMRWPKY